MKEPHHGTGSFQGKRAIELSYQRWRPENVRAVLIAAHGLGEHSGRYLNPMAYFTQKGFAFYALDLRGHGRSQGIKGHVDRFEDYLDDLGAFVDLVREEEGDKPIFLLGHSLGGLIALAYAIRCPDGLSGVIVSSSALKLNMEVPRVKEILGRALSRILPRFTMANELDPNLLSHDEEVVKAYIADPLVHNRISARGFTEMVRAMEETMANADRLRVPCLILHAGDDGLVSPEGGQEFYERAKIADKHLKMYDGFYHELFNEPGKETVFEDIEEWLSSRVPAR